MSFRCTIKSLTLVFVSFAAVSQCWAAQNNVNRRWADTLQKISDSVVALEIARVRPFDFSEQGISTATGFVVDAERGIILTNRHVIGSGPLMATATFQNQERVEVVPLYRDTVHDFGFFQYRPTDLKHPLSYTTRK